MPRSANLSKLIVSECANYQTSGCLGGDVFSRFFAWMPTCVIRHGARCRYFERCLLPLCTRRPDYAHLGDVYWRERLAPAKVEEALGRYFSEGDADRIARHPFFSTAVPRQESDGRYCECGNPLEKGRRLCPECRKKHRRRTHRRARARQRRKTGVRCTTVNENRPLLGKDL